MGLDYQQDFADLLSAKSILAEFHSPYYLRINQRRQEHLATLGLDLWGKSVWEVSAGIGDHTSFFIDRGCEVICSEARPELVALLKRRYPRIIVFPLDLEKPDRNFPAKFDVIYCYGVLYHLRAPGSALQFMASRCRQMFLLETCVGEGDENAENPVDEPAQYFSQAASGTGCRPSRAWVFSQLRKLFPFVYVPMTQPCHEQFPLDWSAPAKPGALRRAIFVASRLKLSNPELVCELPTLQRKQF